MWLCLNRAFISVVHKGCKADEVLCRARRPGDLEKVFPDAKVVESTNTDYRYRAVVKREAVAQALVAEVMGLTYSNFKDSVKDHRLHDAYSRVWGVMIGLQPRRPGPGYPIEALHQGKAPAKRGGRQGSLA